MRYWIMDNDQTPQRFPLQRLIRRICEVTGVEDATCHLLKVRWYGEWIHELDERLDVEETVRIPLRMLHEVSDGTEEWFYDLDAELPDANVRFGLHDSTALFVEAEPAIAEKVVAAFSSYRPAS